MAELATHQAAELLNVSHPFLIGLLGAERIFLADVGGGAPRPRILPRSVRNSGPER